MVARKSGGTAVAARLDALLPKRIPKSAVARFRALSKTRRGQGYLDRFGVSVSQSTRSRWLRGKTSPSKKNAKAVNEAFEHWQADNLERRIAKTRTVEIYPSEDVVAQSRKGGTGSAQVSQQDIVITKSQWSPMIEAWRSGDEAAMDHIWREWVEEQIEGSPPDRAYFTVSHVWFG